MTIQDLEERFIECVEEGRLAQAEILKLVIEEVKQGAPWLDLMNRGCV